MKNAGLPTLPRKLNLNLRRPFLELALRVNGIKIGLNGLLVAVQRLDQRCLVAVGHSGTDPPRLHPGRPGSSERERP